MAADYTSGSAASWSDLDVALSNFLTTYCGWALTPGAGVYRMFSKGALVVQTYYDAKAFYLFGATGISGSEVTGRSTRGAKMASPAGGLISFPISYEIFWNDTPEEVYVVINYNGDKYQHLHFGKSDIPDVGGTGLWYEGSYRDNTGIDDATYDADMFMGSAEGQGNGYIYSTPYSGNHGGYFLHGDQWTGGGIHCGLEGTAWREAWQNNTNNAGYLRGQWQAWPLLAALPSHWNESTILLPIYITMNRSSNCTTTVGVLRHARVTRIDNMTPGEILTLGAEQWKIYPLYAKNTLQRNGVGWNTGAQHSGTLGVALRYPGV